MQGFFVLKAHWQVIFMENYISKYWLRLFRSMFVNHVVKSKLFGPIVLLAQVTVYLIVRYDCIYVHWGFYKSIHVTLWRVNIILFRSCISFLEVSVCLFRVTVALQFEVISRRRLLAAVILWPMWCLAVMPCLRHRTRYHTSSPYTYIGPTWRCAIHWYGKWH